MVKTGRSAFIGFISVRVSYSEPAVRPGSFQSEFLILSQQFDRFGQASLPGFRPLCHGNPAYIVPPVRWSEFLKVVPSLFVAVQGFLDEVRNSVVALPVGPFPLGRVLIGIEDAFADNSQPRIGHLPLSDHRSRALLVVIGPLLLILPGGEFLGKLFVVYTLDQAVDPSEAQRFFNGIIIRDSWPGAGFFVIDQPDLCFCVVVSLQPHTPLVTIGSIKGLQSFQWSSSQGPLHRSDLFLTY